MKFIRRVKSEGSPAELIRRHLAPEAIEFDCPPEAETGILASLDVVYRLRVGNRLIAYAQDAAPILERVHHARFGGDARPMVRPTNLEDVFLALTGTRLEETGP